MKVKQKKSALLPGLITVLMLVAAVAGGLRMTDPDGGRLDTMRQELETITAENEGLTAQVEALRTETAEQKALPEAIQKQKDEGFRLLGELEQQIKAGESDKRIAYLTFDDGPYDNTTDAILDTLKEKGVKAIFFITGDFAKAEPELVQRMIDEGHVVGNHSWKHPNYSGLSVEEAEQDLMKLHDYVKENFNYTMRYFRFPAGNFSERALAEVQQLGYKSLFWSFAYKDWLTDDQPDEAESLTKIVDSACPGMVYLLHAVSKTNANVLADVIDGVAAKGFTWGDPSKI